MSYRTLFTYCYFHQFISLRNVLIYYYFHQFISLRNLLIIFISLLVLGNFLLVGSERDFGNTRAIRGYQVSPSDSQSLQALPNCGLDYTNAFENLGNGQYPAATKVSKSLGSGWYQAATNISRILELGDTKLQTALPNCDQVLPCCIQHFQEFGNWTTPSCNQRF